jgi:uncharacterized protein YndB with AHSA1/START domain
MSDQDLVIVRDFDAPRDLVWNAWTKPELLMRWSGPKGFTTPVYKMDLRVGGAYHTCMRSPEGNDYWSTGIYREIVPPQRLVCTDSFADAEGQVVPASHYGMSADFPLELLVTVSLEDDAGKTRFTLQHAGLPDDALDDCRIGWNESLDKLAELLAEFHQKETG